MKEVLLPSGAKLQITMSPFTPAKALFHAILEEGTQLKMSPGDELDVNLFKDIFCVILSSKKIELALWQCMSKALYNKLPISIDTFEDEKAREDYIQVCVEVALVNVQPFMKNLSAQLKVAQGLITKLDPQ